MRDPVRTASMLSVRQRQVILCHPLPDFPWVTTYLILMGLLDYRRRWFLFGRKGVFLTRLGREVRRHLKAGIG